MNAASKSIKTIILWVLGTGATEFAGFESHSLFITTSFFNSVFVKFVWRIILSLPIQQYLLIGVEIKRVSMQYAIKSIRLFFERPDQCDQMLKLKVAQFFQ